MSRIKELESMLVSALEIVYKARRASLHEEVLNLPLAAKYKGNTVRELLRWRRERRRLLKKIRTVDAAALTKKIARDNKKINRNKALSYSVRRGARK